MVWTVEPSVTILDKPLPRSKWRVPSKFSKIVLSDLRLIEVTLLIAFFASCLSVQIQGRCEREERPSIENHCAVLA